MKVGVMTKCKHWDCGWCYAPDDVKTNALGSGVCNLPEYCPYLKSQNKMTDMSISIDGEATLGTKCPTHKLEIKKMTEIDISKVLIEGDTATIMGVKYQRIIEPQSFYDKLWGLLKTKLGDTCGCDEMADKVRDLIRENIPTPYKGVGLHEWFLGYNEAIKRVNERLFNGIQ